MSSLSRRFSSMVSAFTIAVALGLLSHDVIAFSTVSEIPKKSTSPAASTSSITSVLDDIRRLHEKELEHGFEVFGTSDDTSRSKEWVDTDFACRSVGVGNAGPDEFVLARGDEIFGTVAPVVSNEECDELITEARKVIKEGLERDEQQELPTNSQLGEARVSQMPKAKKWLRQSLHERFFPILESRFGIPANELTLHDALVIGYGYFGVPARSQPVHRDSSLLSLNVALSPFSDYEGGGTFFEGLPAESSIVETERGHVTCHAGGAPHAGRGITSGQRWILVLFVVAKNQPQLARRCHARGMVARSDNDFVAADSAFRAGLTVAPKDHLLHTSLGSVYMAKGDEASARQCLAAAARYPHCQKANMGLGRMMLSNGKPRAALRRFDAVMDWMDDRDLSPDAWMPLRALGWDARVYGGQAAIICTKEAIKLGARNFDGRTHLQRAIDRLQVALRASPQDERILGMLARAKQLLLEYDESNEDTAR